MKMYTVTMKMSAEFASEAKSYMDFEPFNFGQGIRKTLYFCILPMPVRNVSEIIKLHSASVEKQQQLCIH